MEEDIKNIIYNLEMHHMSSKPISDLLQAYKQLEKENERLNSKVTRYKKYLQNQKEKTEELLEYEYTERERDCIPKSVIRDKMEELENNKSYLSTFRDWKEKDYTNEDVIRNCIEVLEEISEE